MPEAFTKKCIEGMEDRSRKRNSCTNNPQTSNGKELSLINCETILTKDKKNSPTRMKCDPLNKLIKSEPLFSSPESASDVSDIID